MSCGCGNKKLIEKYGDIHLHTGPYPIMDDPHGCPNPDHTIQEQPQRLEAISNSPDPSKRYAMVPSENVGGEIGVGCMNTRCMCQNCHGSCNCPAIYPSIDDRLMFNKEIMEPFTVPVINYNFDEQAMGIFMTGLILFLVWYYMSRK